MTTPPTAEIPAQYDPAATEREWYERWLAADAFTADAARSNRSGGDRTPFTIVMPPPNVTAVLHVGHGLNNTVQDVIARWRRMCGDETLWLPGTDHAGIATQNIVEKLLASEGKTTLRSRSRRVHRSHDGVRRGHGRRDPRTVAIDRRVMRLVTHCIHTFAGAVGRGARSVRAAARTRSHLPWSSRHSLVSALSHVVERRGSGARRGSGLTVPHQVRDRGRAGQVAHRCNYAPRNNARRRRTGGESG